MERWDGPTMLVLTRQKLPAVERAGVGAEEGVPRGAYVVLDPPGGQPDSILIATGSEVATAIEAARLLYSQQLRPRVVSMPSWELFAKQSERYRDEVLPPRLRSRVAIEAAGPQGWSRWITDEGAMVGMEGFGASAPGERLFQEFKLTREHIAETVKQLQSRGAKR
jgi:transketolase